MLSYGPVSEFDHRSDHQHLLLIGEGKQMKPFSLHVLGGRLYQLPPSQDKWELSVDFNILELALGDGEVL
jgi:hypothetical protein